MLQLGSHWPSAASGNFTILCPLQMAAKLQGAKKMPERGHQVDHEGRQMVYADLLKQRMAELRAINQQNISWLVEAADE